MVKREIFDRYQMNISNIAGTFIIHDDTPIPTGYKRVYTVISVNVGAGQPSKIRVGLSFDARNHFYEEEPNPTANVYYHTEREYHAKMTRLGVVAIHDAAVGNPVVVNWHGYDQPIEAVAKLTAKERGMP